MEVYGNKISLIDATYKTTRYDLALFFIAVRTNVGYIIVAEFLTQAETASEIGEALAIQSSGIPSGSQTISCLITQMQSLELLSKHFPAAKSICATFIESKPGRGGYEIEAWFECVRWRCSTKSSEKLCMGTTSKEWRSST